VLYNGRKLDIEVHQMKIESIVIQNFRKLKNCKIDLSDKTTLFVGANNSGKTSALDALAKFLSDRKFVYNDITLSNQETINKVGTKWIDPDFNISDISIEDWEAIVPTLDIWINVKNNELQYVSSIIPTLEWTSGKLGVRFMYQPKDIENLFLLYKEAYNAARDMESISTDHKISLTPKNLCEFLNTQNMFINLFSLKSYILDPSEADNEQSQKTSYDMECFEQNPLEGLIKIDIIGAQRGFSDPDASSQDANHAAFSTLSSQLRSYYDKHLDPEKLPTAEDMKTLHAMEEAKCAFNDTLKLKFKSAISELENLGYPGVSDPQITIESKVSAAEAMKHDSAVQYKIAKGIIDEYKLPEKYNGLGYQNLISMVFQLIRFRDDWMCVGKAKTGIEIKRIPPLHLVILEEPEAHLHIQVQQVFIKKAFDILRKHTKLGDNSDFNTQLIISTHSSSIAKEVAFKNLRYFKRIIPYENCIVPTSKVVNLSDVFGKEDLTERFITRYLQTTHCDLFFADAAILVEGSAEYMLVPHFIKHKYSELNQRYITILEINGRHSHRLKPLLEKLCLPTLVITDIDSASPIGHHVAKCPERNNDLISSNYAITSWLLKEKSLDKLLDLEKGKKSVGFATPYPFSIRIAYQIPELVDYKGESSIEAISSTFEDSLTYSNLSIFEKSESNEFEGFETNTGLIGIIQDLIKNSSDFEDLHTNLYQSLRDNEKLKASFALDLIFVIDPKILNVPKYIDEGLKWLELQVTTNE
jgi:predicted ATP-dependent endonuclease of OLD family